MELNLIISEEFIYITKMSVSILFCGGILLFLSYLIANYAPKKVKDILFD